MDAVAGPKRPSFCGSCGGSLQSGERHCGSCGAAVGQAAQDPKAPAVRVPARARRAATWVGAAVALVIVSFGLWSVTESRRAAEVAAREERRREAEARIMLAPTVPETPGAHDIDALRKLARTFHRVAEGTAAVPSDWVVDVRYDAQAVEAVGNAKSGGSYTREDREAFRLAARYAKFAADLVAGQAKDGTWHRSASAEKAFASAASAFDGSLAKATRAAKRQG